jgi:curved DNA-binding protein CbpA
MMNEIATQFRRLARAGHPDRSGAEQAMAAVNNAFERLQAVMR